MLYWHLWDNGNIQADADMTRLWGLHPPMNRQTGKEKRMSSDLQEGFFGCGQQIDSSRKLLEELGSQIAQTDTLDPVHQQVQVGSDLNTSGPLVEPSDRSWGTQISHSVTSEMEIS